MVFKMLGSSFGLTSRPKGLRGWTEAQRQGCQDGGVP